jgi:hypothetical protein
VQPQVDEIYVMEGGRVQQRGTYADLVSKAFDFGALLQQVAALVARYQLHIPNGWFAARRSCFQAERGRREILGTRERQHCILSRAGNSFAFAELGLDRLEFRRTTSEQEGIARLQMLKLKRTRSGEKDSKLEAGSALPAPVPFKRSVSDNTTSSSSQSTLAGSGNDAASRQ